jgi:hypothetical protein
MTRILVFEGAKSSRSKNGSSTNIGGSDKVEGADYTRKRWETQGLSLMNGVLQVHCKQCIPNTTHSTRLHKAFVEQDPA